MSGAEQSGPPVIMFISRTAMSNFAKQISENSVYLVLCLLILAAFTMGGSARSDTQTLALLRPFAIIVLGFGLCTLRITDIRNNREISIVSALLVLVNLFYLIPLPSGMHGGGALGVVSSINELAAGRQQMRPLALSSYAALNANFALLVPLAATILLIQLNRKQRYSLLPFCIALCVASGLLGLMQSISGPNGSLYFYRVTNNGSAVGIFANRNHQAVYLATLFPMLAVYYVTADQKDQRSRKFRLWLAITGSIVLIPLILITGSRGGLLAAMLGMLSALWAFHHWAASASPTEKKASFNLRVLLAAGAVAVITTLTLFMSRAEAILRLFAPSVTTDSRSEFWSVTFKAAQDQLPWGFGPGGFSEAFRLNEPTNLLDSTYLNHAHNDFLELFNDFGILALILFVAAFTLFFVSYRKAAKSSHGRDTAYRFLGFAGLLILLLGSIADYPLRTPFVSVFAMILLVWCTGNQSTLKNEPIRSKLVD